MSDEALNFLFYFIYLQTTIISDRIIAYYAEAAHKIDKKYERIT